jgi:hypothetical protein
MALNIYTTATADTKIQNLSPSDFVEFDQAMAIASGANLPGGQHGLRHGKTAIAILNHRYDIHLLVPGSPCPYVLCVHDGGSDMLIVDLKDRNQSPITSHMKRSFATECASALGVITSDIHEI